MFIAECRRCGHRLTAGMFDKAEGWARDHVDRLPDHVVAIQEAEGEITATAASPDEDHRRSGSVRPVYAGLPTLGKK